jgi:hypothetical protein
LAKAKITPEIQNYEFFKTNILTPEDYVEMCEQYEITGILEDWQDVDGPKDLDDLLYLSDGHPSYTHVYKTLRMKYFEQQQIINDKRDSRSLKLAFQQFFNLRELSLVFSQAQGNEHWERDYQDMFDVADLKSYQHHIQLVLAGLVTKQNAPLREIELHSLKLPIGAFTFPEDPPPDYLHWNSLTTVLTELVKHTPRLRLVESGLALALLSGESLNIHELDLRSIDTGMVFIESFLQHNAKSLRSLVAHMIYVTGRDQGNSSYLTPTHISEIKGLRIEGQKRPYIDWAEKGWKLVFSHS